MRYIVEDKVRYTAEFADSFEEATSLLTRDYNEDELADYIKSDEVCIYEVGEKVAVYVQPAALLRPGNTEIPPANPGESVADYIRRLSR